MKILKLFVELVLHGFYITTKLAEINLCIFTVSPPGFSVHGILQARIPFSKGSSEPKDQSQVSRIVGRFFTIWVTRETHAYI